CLAPSLVRLFTGLRRAGKAFHLLPPAATVTAAVPQEKGQREVMLARIQGLISPSPLTLPSLLPRFLPTVLSTPHPNLPSPLLF
ncbi:unnamed protein product, partial [Closterium sp. Naga37s-1]